MKNSIRFFSRALTGAFLTLILLGQSLLGQLTSMEIIYPTRDTALVEGQAVNVVVSMQWDLALPEGEQGEDKLTLLRVYEGIVTELYGGVTAVEVTFGRPNRSFSDTLPTLTGVSNEITYMVRNSIGSVEAEITVRVGEISPVDGRLTSINIEFPQENANVNVGVPSLTLSATVEPLQYTRLTTVDFFVDGYKINESPVTSTTGFFNFEWNEQSMLGRPWVGNIKVTARATLNNGTYVDTTAPRRFNVRPIGSAPEVIIEDVDGTNDVVGGMNKAFNVHVNDSGSLVESVGLYVNGVKVSEKDASGYSFSFDYQMPQYGIVEVWSLVDFSNGNRARTEILRYVLNTGTAPVVQLLSPLDGATFLPGSEAKIFATAYDPDSLISTIDFFVNDTHVNTVERVANDVETDGNFTTERAKRNLFEFNYMFPFAGEYRIYAQARDESGTATRSNVVRVTAGAADRSYPTVAMSPTGGSFYGQGSTLWLNAYASDEDGSIRSVKFFVNGQEIGETSLGWGNTYAYQFHARNTGIYYVYAQAKDNHGKISQSAPVSITVQPLTGSMPTIYLDEIDAVYQDLAAGLDPVVLEGEINVPTEAYISFYGNGVFLGEIRSAGGYFETSFIPMFVGTLSITAVVTDGRNTAVSNDRILRVAPQGQSIAFAEYVVNNFLYRRLFEQFLDPAISWSDGYYNVIIRSLDSGQRTRAEWIHELMQADDAYDQDSAARPAANFKKIRNALMIRWCLTDTWPTPRQLENDIEMIRQLGADDEGSGERRLVRLFLPAFQTKFCEGKNLPDSFSSKKEFERFFTALFNRKYGMNPTGEQLDRALTVLRMGGTEWFVRDFILDNETMPFGDNKTVSTLLGLPNLPSNRLSRYADSASLFIGLLKVVPLQSDVESRAELPLIEQIQIILDAMPAI